jgi:hypothetical protein
MDLMQINQLDADQSKGELPTRLRGSGEHSEPTLAAPTLSFGLGALYFGTAHPVAIRGGRRLLRRGILGGA